MDNLTILITGATGKTGGYAIQRLLDMKATIRALVHQHDARSEALAAQGVEIVQGDLGDFDAVHAALKGVTAAYFVYPIQVPGILTATAYFAQAALEHGVSAVVNMSQITARRAAKSRAARDHWMAERLLDRSGVPVTHLRPTLFAEWLFYFRQPIKEKSILPLPFGDGRYAPITAEDQGRAIAEILMQPAKHAGKTYPLFGLHEMTQYEIADDLSKVVGRKITYVPMEIDAFGGMLKEMGFNAHFRQHVAAIAQDGRDGVLSGSNDNIEQLTGQKPMGMLEYIEKNRQMFI